MQHYKQELLPQPDKEPVSFEPNNKQETSFNFEQFGETLRDKWCEIPATRKDRMYSSELLKWPDACLLEYWEECKNQFGEIRRWYHELYKDSFRGKEVADIGPGIGLDGIYFAENGAKITFVDIVEDNLKLLERICSLKGIKVDYYYIDNFFNYHFNKRFDIFMFIGSMHNAPFEFSKRQVDAMTPFLKLGGKIIMLAYPKERFIQSGAKSFAEFGKMTDGERTPWAEWYDDNKVCKLFGNNFRLNWSCNFGKDGIEFNWFDLTKIKEDRVPELESTQSKIIVKPPIIIPSVPEEKSTKIPQISQVLVFELHKKLEFKIPIEYPKTSLQKPLDQWRMEIDDAPIFRYIYRNFQPRRHLEFGTWQGTGTIYCLEECDATVWTINIFEGENKSDGSIAYSHSPDELSSIHAWTERIGLEKKEKYRTDSFGFIGRYYLENQLGHRVCQIYCDSRNWDITNYPQGFFDTVLIDGGHQQDVVINDTHKALKLLRSGGIIMWHDFCPIKEVYDKFECVKDVVDAITTNYEWLNTQLKDIFWINPSWILIGIKK